MSRVRNEYPDRTKYIVEAHGDIVKRYVEYPNGCRVELSNRKSHRCSLADTVASIVPDQADEGGKSLKFVSAVPTN
jgi:hypothetical protein